MLPIFIRIWSTLNRFLAIFIKELFPSLHFNAHNQSEDDWRAVKLSNQIFHYYLETTKSHKKTKSRPLCILLLWFTAKKSLARKYEDIYRRRGFDIVSVHTTIFDIMFPGKLSERLVLELETSLSDYNSLVVHSFSSGVMHLAAIVNEIHLRQQLNNNNCEKILNESRGQSLKPLDERLKALVFDCVIDFEIIAHGKTAPNTVYASKFFKSFAKFYLWLFPSTKKYYTDIMESVYKSELRAIGLAFLTLTDKYNNVEQIEKIAAVWRRNKMDLTLKYWDDCEHVQIYRKYPEQYLFYIDELLKKADLI